MRRLSQICQTELHVTRLTQIPRIKGFGHRNKAARIVSFIYLFLTLLGCRIYRGRWSVVLQSVNNKNGNVEGYVDQKVDFSLKKFPRAGCVCFLNGARPRLQHNNRYYYANVMGQSRRTIFWDAPPTQRYSFFRNLPSLFTSL